MAKDEDSAIRPFRLFRAEDVSGVSGEGFVAEGVVFSDGTTVLRWLTNFASTVIWQSLEHAMAIHGHDGKTSVVWVAAGVRHLPAEERDVHEAV